MTGTMPAGYSAALDEIFRLRQLLALEAESAESVLSYRTLPANARATVEHAIIRMRSGARGDTLAALDGWSSLTLQNMLINAGGSATLSRTQW